VRWLTDATGAITDAVDYNAFGNEIHRSGSTTTEHLYRGEQFDPNLGFYYLRARWMDPASGRFVGMDSFAGVDTIPGSLHDFAYVASDPVNARDPSGLMSLPETSYTARAHVSLSMSNVSTAAVNTARVAVNDALWAGGASAGVASAARVAGLGILTSLALTADSQRRDRLIGIPLIVFGLGFPEHSQHIRDAQTGEGSNFRPITFALNRSPEWSRSWLRMTPECNDAARARAGAGKACDEYPFARSRQGGPVNYVAWGVSLRFVDSAESSATGRFLSRFYDVAGISRDGFSRHSRFLVLGVPGNVSFFTDRTGNVHSWNQ
jgi:RHS repeat-associated protein